MAPLIIITGKREVMPKVSVSTAAAIIWATLWQSPAAQLTPAKENTLTLESRITKMVDSTPPASEKMNE